MSRVDNTRWDPEPHRGLVSRTLWQAGIFWAYFAQFVKMRLAYRMDFFVDTLAVSFSMVIQLAVLTTLFSKVKALEGWSFEQVLFIYAFSLLPLGIFNIVSVNLYRFSDNYIIQGKFDRVLLRPVGTLAQVIFESFNVSGLNEIIMGIVSDDLRRNETRAGFRCRTVSDHGGHGPVRGSGLHGRFPGHHLGVLLARGSNGFGAPGLQHHPI